MEGEDFLKNLEEESNNLREQNSQLNTALSSASYQGQEDANLIVYQVDTGEMLGKLEHFLRGEHLTTDREGNEYWTKPKKTIKQIVKRPVIETSTYEDGSIIEKEVIIKEEIEVEVDDEKLILFNDYGVNSIMSIIGNYIDKNTILSFYDEMRINEILADLGEELADFIYCNYETMGMDTDFKKTRYKLTVLTIIHSIESAYRRALRGKASEDINSSKIFTQMDNIGKGQQTPIKKKFNLFKPGTW